MATLAKLLQANMGLPDMAKRLAAAGRGKDSILAHINPKEASLLKARGGSGKINPDTGIMEFDDYDENQPQEPSYAPAAQDPAQRQQAQYSQAAPPAEATSSQLPSVGEAPTAMQNQYGYDTATPVNTANAAPATGATSGQLPAVGAAPAKIASDLNKQTGQSGGGFIEGVKNFGNQLGDLNKALSPVTPWLKGAGAIYGAVQGNKASEQAQQQAAANEAEIRKLADPYKQRGQQLVDLGQAGGLTSTQQKQLEVQRAVASQQMASSGVTGGTAQQQLEANLQQQAAAFAQQNIDQGMKLMGISDEYIMKAMNTGYSQNKDAQALAQDFYKSIAQFLEPEVNTNPTQQANAAPK